MKTLLTTLFLFVSLLSWGQMKGTFNYNYAEFKEWDGNTYITKDVSFTRNLFIFNESVGLWFNEELDDDTPTMFYMDSDSRNGVLLHIYSLKPGSVLIVDNEGRLLSIFYELKDETYQKCITIFEFYIND